MFSRVRRKLFIACSIVSLLLCVSVGALWVRSTQHQELVQARYNHWPQPDEARLLYSSITSYGGTLTFRLEYLSYTSAYFRSQRPEVLGIVRNQRPSGITCISLGPKETIFLSPPELGFSATHYRDTRFFGYRRDNWWLAAPHWFVMLMLLVLPAWWAVRFWRARRIRQIGLCPACGYDLRASPERCPECGLVRGNEATP